MGGIIDYQVSNWHIKVQYSWFSGRQLTDRVDGRRRWWVCLQSIAYNFSMVTLSRTIVAVRGDILASNCFHFLSTHIHFLCPSLAFNIDTTSN